jgi:hypothetical protein
MKQQPTLEQWIELSYEQQLEFWKKLGLVNSSIKKDDVGWIPTIGEMIEFLENGGISIDREKPHCWSIGIKNTNQRYNDDNELCDALWEAVKHKLNNNNK